MYGSVTGRRRPGLIRRALLLLTGLILAATSLSIASPASAQFGTGKGTKVDCKSINGQAVCKSSVTFSVNGTGTTVAAPKGWTPPACWYEPSIFTPTFLEITYKLPIPLVNALVLLLTGGDTGTGGDGNFHDGEKGRWWGFVYNPAMPDAQAQCQLTGYPPLEWVPDTTPPPQEAVTAWKMAAAAAKEIPVNPPTLTLQPGANNQVVNLPTLVSLNDQFNRTWVTARLDVNGYVLAATTIATPASITVNAGTPNASPSSCTYTLAPDAGNYQVDPSSTKCSDGSAGPNAGIVYRRPTAPGTSYPLTATVTWKVTWTDTDSPDSPPQTDPGLGPLTLDTPMMPVIVNEVETVNH